MTRFFIHYTGTAPTNADLTTFAGSIRAAWNTNLKALVSSTEELLEVDCQDLSSSTGAQGIDTTAVTGTRAGGILPGSTAVVISYNIARRYRGGHPRGYWRMGVAPDLLYPSEISAALVAAAQTGIDAFFTAVLAAGWTGAGTLTHCNVSYFQGFTVHTNPTTGRATNVPSPRGTPVVDTVTSRKVKQILGHQRRRG